MMHHQQLDTKDSEPADARLHVGELALRDEYSLQSALAARHHGHGPYLTREYSARDISRFACCLCALKTTCESHRMTANEPLSGHVISGLLLFVMSLRVFCCRITFLEEENSGLQNNLIVTKFDWIKNCTKICKNPKEVVELKLFHKKKQLGNSIDD